MSDVAQALSLPSRYSYRLLSPYTHPTPRVRNNADSAR
jgi:hypothetical protein